MAQNRDEILTVIDIGSVKTSVLVAEVTAEGALVFRGYGESASGGMRKGLIAELEKATKSVQRAAEQAEAMAGCNIESAVASIGGAHIKGLNSRGGILLGSKQHEISREDVRAAVERARSIQLPNDRQVLHLLPQEFIIDEQPGIQDPVGMTGMRLECNLHIVTASASAVQSVITAVNKAGIEVSDTVFDGVASAEALAGVGPSERTLGCCVIDIGAASTEMVAYYEGAIVHTAVVGIGGEHFTSDVAIGLKTPLAEAERLKCMYGCAVVVRVPTENDIEVPGIGGSIKMVSQRYLAEILESRASELFRHVRESLRGGGVLELMGAGVFLTGGGARLVGIEEICEQVLRAPVQIEAAVPALRMPAHLEVPELAGITGLLAYAHRTRNAKRAEEQGLGAKLRQIFAGV